MLTTPTSRVYWGGSALVMTLAGTAIIQLAFGLGLGPRPRMMYAGATSDATQLPMMIAATLIKPPAIWLLAAAALVHGFAPRNAVVALIEELRVRDR